MFVNVPNCWGSRIENVEWIQPPHPLFVDILLFHACVFDSTKMSVWLIYDNMPAL